MRQGWRERRDRTRVGVLAGVRAAARAATLVVALSAIGGWASLPAAAQYSGPGPTNAPQAPPKLPLTTDKLVLFPRVHETLLGPGDVLSVRLFAEPDYSPQVRLDSNGTVQLPLIGVLHLGGLSVPEATDLIQARLKDGGYYRDPQVTVQVVEGPNAVVTVIGEIHSVVTVAGSRRLQDVLAQAGGLPASASHVITIHRPGVEQPIVVDLGTDPLQSSLGNVPVFPGDTIVVARIGVVYMVGDFKTTGTISLTPYSQLTLMQAMALSGGPLYQGKLNDLRLIRTVGDHRTVVKLDLKKVLDGKAPDPILEANDILFLPDSALKASIVNGNVGTLLGVAGLLISLSYR